MPSPGYILASTMAIKKRYSLCRACSRFDQGVSPGQGGLLLEVLSAGEVGRDKKDGTHGDFLMHAASGVSGARSRPPRSSSKTETGHLGGGLPSPSQYDLNRNFSKELAIQALFARVPIYEPYGKISERAYSESAPRALLVL
jgi:hypothetical protein